MIALQTGSFISLRHIMKALLLFSLLTCLVMSLHAETTGAAPTRFAARIGGVLGTTYAVELKDGVLIYSTIRGRDSSEPVRITPTEEQWRAFRTALDDLKVWQWNGDYLNRRIFDGTQWKLDIDYSNQSVSTKGSNAYPDDKGHSNGKPEFTPAFSRYLKAVEALIGNRPFR